MPVTAKVSGSIYQPRDLGAQLVSPTLYFIWIPTKRKSGADWFQSPDTCSRVTRIVREPPGAIDAIERSTRSGYPPNWFGTSTLRGTVSCCTTSFKVLRNVASTLPPVTVFEPAFF